MVKDSLQIKLSAARSRERREYLAILFRASYFLCYYFTIQGFAIVFNFCLFWKKNGQINFLDEN